MEIVRTRMANSRTATAIGLILVALGLADSFMQPSAFGGSRIGSSSTLGRARVCSRAARGLALRAEKVGESMMQYDVSEESNEDSSKPIVVQIEQKVKEVINKPAQMEMEREVFKVVHPGPQPNSISLYSMSLPIVEQALRARIFLIIPASPPCSRKAYRALYSLAEHCPPQRLRRLYVLHSWTPAFDRNRSMNTQMCAMTNRGQGATLYEREAMESAVDRCSFSQ